MSDDNWNKIKQSISGKDFVLGPYFGHQISSSQRHLLFTLSRYKFAAKMLKAHSPSSILELGCNEGIGAVMMDENGSSYLGVDADSDAIKYAQLHLQTETRKFEEANFLGKNFGEYDSILSLDVIEHIEKDDEDIFFQTVVDNLDANGHAVIGTPNDSAFKYASEASQIGHVNMFEGDRLVKLAQKYFNNVFLFGVNDEVVHTGFYPMTHYLVVLCVNKK